MTFQEWFKDVRGYERIRRDVIVPNPPYIGSPWAKSLAQAAWEAGYAEGARQENPPDQGPTGPEDEVQETTS